ncbi:hypothetical protein [Actinomadura harenae]|uniref:hypothetical protein n=1 Tax=Actinomadura harenae TaxID=2483351 RepID=UPI0011C461AD|nr:hypothetical protein [Actinomadura harenae]
MTILEKAAPFPKDAAATVRHWADFFAYQPALDMLDLVEDMVGHPENVQRVVGSWERAAGAMSASLRHAQSAHYEIASSWTGPASLGFTAYIADVKTRVPANVTAMQTAIQATSSLYTTIIGAYKTCVNFITACANNLTNFVGSALSDWKSYLAGLTAATGVGTPAAFALEAKHFSGLLADFVEQVKSVIDDSLDQHAEQVKALNGVGGAVVSIDAPGAPSERIKDSDSWKPL